MANCPFARAERCVLQRKRSGRKPNKNMFKKPGDEREATRRTNRLCRNKSFPQIPKFTLIKNNFSYRDIFETSQRKQGWIKKRAMQTSDSKINRGGPKNGSAIKTFKGMVRKMNFGTQPKSLAKTQSVIKKQGPEALYLFAARGFYFRFLLALGFGRRI